METTATTESEQARPAGVASLADALGVGLGLLAGIFIVVRPGSQISPYSGEAAFAGLIATVFGCVVVAQALIHPRRQTVRFGRALPAALTAWLALFAVGLWRSSNFGAGIPMAANAGLYAMMLLCGFFLARLEPLLSGAIVRGIVGMAAVEAFAGCWQRFVGLPLLQAQVATGAIPLPEKMKSGLGLARLAGLLGFGSFENPNSLAGYLLIGLFLLLGVLWRSGGASKAEPAQMQPPQSKAPAIFGWLVIVLILAGLGSTGSKGGMAAAVAGLWFFAAQWLALKAPQYRRLLGILTIAGVAAVVALLALGTFGALWPRPFGFSMEARLDYWRSALAMWKEHPFGGVGLGGFTDNYPLFKMPMGEEVRDTHNDFLQLAAELGLLAPFIYGAIWWLVVRPNSNEGLKDVKQPATGLFHTFQLSSAGPPVLRSRTDFRDTAPGQAGNAERRRLLDLCVVIGGVLAFFLMDYGFEWFESEHVFNFMHGKRELVTTLGVLHTMALPIVFAVTVMALQPLVLRLNEGWTFGCRAAIGAVLVHELVDFDFRAPATMTAIFLCGGLLAGARAAELPGGSRAGWFASRRPGLALLALVLLLAPAIAWIPLRSGRPRANAETLEDEIVARMKKAELNGAESPEGQSIPQIRADILDQRKQARDAAPFDAETWLDLGNAYELLPPSRATAQHRNEALVCYEKAVQLRPLSFNPKMVLGEFFMRHAFNDLSSHDADAAREKFKKAREAFAAASARYPLCPGLKLSEGDAALMSGDAAGAGEAYAKAFAIDQRIDDNTTRLSAIFTDPRPGAFPRNGFEGEKFIVTKLAAAGQTEQLSPAQSFGMRVRLLTWLTWILHQNQLTPSLKGADLKGFRSELTSVAEQLAATAPGAPGKAHAALLRALATRMLADDDRNGRAALSDKLWNEAITLQKESLDKGQPGTPQRTFETIEKSYRKQPPNEKGGLQ